PDYTTDVLVIGGGGAGNSAALMAYENGADVIIATKLRLGDANTMMAQGGIQAAVTPIDSPAIHYLDVLGGGHFKNIPELVEGLVNDAPYVIEWLEQLGVMFDKDPDGKMWVQHGGGTSRMRMHSCRDYSGAGIMRVLRDEVRNHPDKIHELEFSPAVELILNERRECIGALLFNMETEEYLTVYAKSVVLATGGFGRLHIQKFPTTNHYGATGDGLVMGYRAGIPIMFLGAVQYHPTGAMFPEQIVGLLITEKVRGSGADVVNAKGEKFVFPLEPRDVESSAIIRECTPTEQGGKGNGVRTPTGNYGVWLDSPLIDVLYGEGTIQRKLPAMVRMFERFGIDMTKEPILVYPTLHYQNGGLKINADGSTDIPGLFAGGEVSGGVHGTNRLMGNSLLDVVVYGRRSGISAAIYAQNSFKEFGKATLQHIMQYENELDQAGIPAEKVSPVILPNYIPDEIRNKQLTAHWEGNLL
ncbi:succinate dehydrogenase/fumarate reductase flavoprotein subunit, partial [bacterium]